jgi:hypothetical protein
LACLEGRSLMDQRFALRRDERLELREPGREG